MEGKQILNGFCLERLLGVGGMAEVWAANEIDGSHSVALKILLPEFLKKDKVRRRFEREGELRLQHPNIVPILKTVHINGRSALVMPLYTGGSLETHIRRTSEEQHSGIGKPVPIQQALSIAYDVLAALDYAHRHGTIHRDVKPTFCWTQTVVLICLTSGLRSK